MGHIAKNCRVARRQPGQFGKGGGRGGGNQGAGGNPAAGRACHNCKKVGHYARDCPEPKTEEQRQYHQQRQGQGRGTQQRPGGAGGRPRGQGIHSGQEVQLFQFMLEEIDPTTATTTTTTTTATTATDLFPIPAQPRGYLGHSAVPPPPLGQAQQGVTKPSNGAGSCIANCRLKEQSKGRKSCCALCVEDEHMSQGPWQPSYHSFTMQPGELDSDPTWERPRKWPPRKDTKWERPRKWPPLTDSEGFVTVRSSFRPPLVSPKTSTAGPKTSGNHFEALQESDGVEDDDEKKMSKSAKDGTPTRQPDNPVALRGCKQDPVRAAPGKSAKDGTSAEQPGNPMALRGCKQDSARLAPEPSAPLLALRGCRRSAVRFAAAAAGDKDGTSGDAICKFASAPNARPMRANSRKFA